MEHNPATTSRRTNVSDPAHIIVIVVVTTTTTIVAPFAVVVLLNPCWCVWAHNISQAIHSIPFASQSYIAIIQITHNKWRYTLPSTHHYSQATQQVEGWREG